MKKSSLKHGQIFLAAVMITLAIPLTTQAKDIGHDWYCSDPEAHAQYEKHRKLHSDKDAEILAEMLAKVYSDPSLTTEQKKENAVKILKKDPKIKTEGNGVGD